MAPPSERAEADPAHAERLQLLALLPDGGVGATCFQGLERGFSRWFDPAGDAAVAYVAVRGWWVAAGAPVAPPARQGPVAAAFVAAGRAAGRRVAFFGVEAALAEGLAAAGIACGRLLIGTQPEWRPAAYHLEGPSRRSLRAQLRRAARKGVRVRRVAPGQLASGQPLRAALEEVLAAWLAGRPMGVMRFMVDVEPFSFPDARRYYVAERAEPPAPEATAPRAVGFLAAVPVPARRGWFLEDLLRIPGAPNGTAEALVDAALRDAAAEGDALVTLGLAPLAAVRAGPGPQRGLRRLLVWCRSHLGALYSFEGVRAFKARFRPDRWTPLYLVAAPGPAGARALLAVLRAFAGGRLAPFAWETARRLAARRPGARAAPLRAARARR